MSIAEARTYVDSVQDLTAEEKKHLKQLLNTATLVHGAIIGAGLNDLREMIAMNPLRGKFPLLYLLCIIS